MGPTSARLGPVPTAANRSASGDGRTSSLRVARVAAALAHP